MKQENILRIDHNMLPKDYDLTLVNNILSVTIKTINDDFNSYHIVETFYYKIEKIDFDFLKNERWSINVISIILKFIKKYLVI